MTDLSTAWTSIFCTIFSSTVEPLYNGNPGGTAFWPLYGGGLCRGVLAFGPEDYINLKLNTLCKNLQGDSLLCTRMIFIAGLAR